MKLGIINGWSEESFAYVAEKKLEFIEWCVNNRNDTAVIENDIENIKARIKKYNVPIASVGSWGHDRIDPKTGGTSETEYSCDARLVDICEKIGCPVFVTGVNRVETMTLLDNVNAAVAYLKKITAFASSKGVKVAVYNCGWNNFVCEPKIWDLVLPNVPGLGIKYDTSHCIGRGGDYLKETRDYGDKFYHIHIKGTLNVDGKHFDDPPAGLDQTNWGAFMDVLYSQNYKGGLSIEPHSKVWNGERSSWGVDFTIDYMRKLVIPENYTDSRKAYMPKG